MHRCKVSCQCSLPQVPEQQHHGKASVEKWLGSNLYGTTLTAEEEIMSMLAKSFETYKKSSRNNNNIDRRGREKRKYPKRGVSGTTMGLRLGLTSKIIMLLNFVLLSILTSSSFYYRTSYLQQLHYSSLLKVVVGGMNE